MKNIFTCLFLIGIVFACNKKPKIIVADEHSITSSSSTDGAASNPSSVMPSGADTETESDVHQVVAEEILQAEKYTYIYVSENQEKFWIAVSKQEIKKGEKYFYRGGLKKTNFQSQEFNRVFDVIYLVGKIINASEHPGGVIDNSSPGENTSAEITSTNVQHLAGSIPLAELIKKKNTYKDKLVQVEGKCVKANYQIMGRNWYHIQNGEKLNGKVLDLTVTSSDQVQIGQQVVFEGILSLQKDFGAGYAYDLILENAKIKMK